MDNMEKIFYLGKASQLVMEMGADISCIEQIEILSNVLKDSGEEHAKMIIAMGELFKDFLDIPESELDF